MADAIKRVIRGLALVGLALSNLAAYGASDEIQVYTEEMDDPGTFGLELHVNYVPRGRKTETYPGEMASHHRLQVTPEFSYGITKSLEAGLYLPVALASDGHFYGNGMRLRLKYIAPREEGETFFWGLNGELGSSAQRVSESPGGLEIRPIIGYRDDRWLLSFNPILNADLSGEDRRKPIFEPALKVTRTVKEGVAAGFEYYGEYGQLSQMLPSRERTHSLYGVLDVEWKGLDFNLGIGRGIRNAEDSWILKAIVAFPF